MRLLKQNPKQQTVNNNCCTAVLIANERNKTSNVLEPIKNQHYSVA